MSDSYKNLPYNHVTFKASHNSYQRDEQPISTQLDWRANSPADCGCRGSELDIWYKPNNEDEEQFMVSHHDGKLPCKHEKNNLLGSYLTSLRRWHDVNFDHDPVLLILDVKDDKKSGDFQQDLDVYLKRYLKKEVLFTPANLLKNNPDIKLDQYVKEHGWPTVKDLFGKFIVCLSGDHHAKLRYMEQGGRNALCFCDYRPRDDENHIPATKGDFIFYNFHNIYPNFKSDVKKVLEMNGFVRSFKPNHEDDWNKSMKLGVNCIATDKVSNHGWAKVSDDAPFVKRKDLEN